MCKASAAALPKQPPYLLNWMARGILLCAMHRAGVHRLLGSREVTVEEFAVAFPDSCQWLRVLPLRSSDCTLQTLFETLEYDGRPELFSFWTCLLLTRDCRMAPSWFDENVQAISKHRRWYFRSHGLHVVPARCVSQLVKGVRAL